MHSKMHLQIVNNEQQLLVVTADKKRSILFCFISNRNKALSFKKLKKMLLLVLIEFRNKQDAI